MTVWVIAIGVIDEIVTLFIQSVSYIRSVETMTRSLPCRSSLGQSFNRGAKPLAPVY